MSMEMIVRETLDSCAPNIARSSASLIIRHLNERKRIDAEFRIKMKWLEEEYAHRRESREALFNDRKMQLQSLHMLLQAAVSLNDKELKDALVRGIEKFMDNTPNYLSS